MSGVEVTLPGGVAVGTQWCRSVWLNSVTGYEEEFLIGEGKLLPPAVRVTQLLLRCLRRIGPVEPVEAALVRQLTVGDREALLLQLRRLTLGERLSSVLQCPSCKEKMDLDMNIAELLLPEYAHEGPLHETTIDAFRVTFRVPNGEDQEAVAELAKGSLESAEQVVLKRCIARVTSESGEELDRVPPSVVRDLPAKMAELDPQAEVLLDLSCPECGTRFEVPFDIGDYLTKEIGGQERDLYFGVHTLSFHYHWNEDAILKLSRRKRHLYLDLLADQVSSGRSA